MKSLRGSGGLYYEPTVTPNGTANGPALIAKQHHHSWSWEGPNWQDNLNVGKAPPLLYELRGLLERTEALDVSALTTPIATVPTWPEGVRAAGGVRSRRRHRRMAFLLLLLLLLHRLLQLLQLLPVLLHGLPQVRDLSRTPLRLFRSMNPFRKTKSATSPLS